MGGLNDQESQNSSSSDSSSWRNKMKKFYDEAMVPLETKPCEGSRNELRECLMLSDCYLKQRRSLKDCARANDGSVNPECLAIKNSFFDCKRSLLDNRQRFRGRKGY